MIRDLLIRFSLQIKIAAIAFTAGFYAATILAEIVR